MKLGLGELGSHILITLTTDEIKRLIFDIINAFRFVGIQTSQQKRKSYFQVNF